MDFQEIADQVGQVASGLPLVFGAIMAVVVSVWGFRRVAAVMGGR